MNSPPVPARYTMLAVLTALSLVLLSLPHTPSASLTNYWGRKCFCPAQHGPSSACGTKWWLPRCRMHTRECPCDTMPHPHLSPPPHPVHVPFPMPLPIRVPMPVPLHPPMPPLPTPVPIQIQVQIPSPVLTTPTTPPTPANPDNPLNPSPTGCRARDAEWKRDTEFGECCRESRRQMGKEWVSRCSFRAARSRETTNWWEVRTTTTYHTLNHYFRCMGGGANRRDCCVNYGIAE